MSSERLSSGLRINRASDDAAGLSVSATLNADARIYTQGIRNINDGISLLSVADSALEQLSTITIRQRELAVQSANGVYSSGQRAALQNESNALTNEFNRLVESTDFNGRKLLDSSLNDFRIQAGKSLAESVDLVLGQALGGGTGTTTETFASGTAQVAQFSAPYAGTPESTAVTFVLDVGGAYEQLTLHVTTDYDSAPDHETLYLYGTTHTYAFHLIKKRSGLDPHRRVRHWSLPFAGPN